MEKVNLREKLSLFDSHCGATRSSRSALRARFDGQYETVQHRVMRTPLRGKSRESTGTTRGDHHAIDAENRPLSVFDDQAEQAATFYTSVFKNSKIVKIARYGEAGVRSTRDRRDR
jgi:hypothetical protein